MSYYEILKVDFNASQRDIHKAYIKLVKLYHPDNNNSKSALIRMKEINEAYRVLGDEHERKRYDKNLGFKKQTYSNTGTAREYAKKSGVNTENSSNNKTSYDDIYEKKAQQFWNDINDYFNKNKVKEETEEEQYSDKTEDKNGIKFVKLILIMLSSVLYIPFSILVVFILLIGIYVNEVERSGKNRFKMIVGVCVIGFACFIVWYFILNDKIFL